MAAHTDNEVGIGAPRDFVWERMMDVELARPVQRVRQGRGDRAGWRHDQFRLTTHPDPEYDGQVWSWVSERVADPGAYTSKSRGSRPGRSST